MKNALFNIVILSILYARATTMVAQELSYGLEFKSFDVAQEKRTSLNLTPQKSLLLPNGFIFSFEMRHQSVPDYNFGYIFRLIGKNEQYIDFLINPTSLKVVSSANTVLATCVLTEIERDDDSFFPFSMQVDGKKNRLSIKIGNLQFSNEAVNLANFEEVRINFGRCNYVHFQSSDVPKIVVKDVKISNLKNETQYFWALKSHADNGVYDEENNKFAVVENPVWLLDTHARWKKRLDFSAMLNPQIAINHDDNQIAIADRKNFYIYDTKSYSIVRKDKTEGLIHSVFANQMIHNSLDHQWYSYLLDTIEGMDILPYDSKNMRWDNDEKEEKYVDFWHHNKLFSKTDNSFYTFNGYGHHKYKNSVTKYSFTDRRWAELTYQGDHISPRYLSGLGTIDENVVLLFGGYGSETGDQEFAPHNFYDLYEIDLQGLKAKKIWEMPHPKIDFVVANSMVIDTLNRCFYALCFPQQQSNTSLFLARFSMERPEYEVVSDEIPFMFRDIVSYADLLLNPLTKELTAITYSSESTDSVSVVSIYTLAYPPIEQQSVYQYVKSDNNNYWLYITLITLAILVVVYFSFYRKLQKKKINFDKVIAEGIDIEKPLLKREKRHAVYLFGGFQIWDKNGNDITVEFSPLAKQFFLIILLNTLKEDGKGISSSKLKEIFWYDKSVEAARNNRGVTVSKLRQIFEKVGSVNIECENSHWTVRFGDEVHCDYSEAVILLRNLKKKSGRTKESVLKLTEIVSFGDLLPNVQLEWVDPFKANFANDLIDILLDANSQKEFNFSLQDSVNIANAVLIHDILNEDALKIKCSALMKMGKNGLANTAYNTFVKEYQNLFGIKFKLTLEQLLS